MRNLALFIVVPLLVVVAVACNPLKEPTTLLDGGNRLSSSGAADAMTDVLATRTFTDGVGFAHSCDEYISSLIIGAWESDSTSWLLTLTGNYERATRVFRFSEADSTFTQVAGPPLDEACGVT